MFANTAKQVAYEASSEKCLAVSCMSKDMALYDLSVDNR